MTKQSKNTTESARGVREASPTPTLRAFTDGIDTVVAFDEDDAREVHREFVGERDCDPPYEEVDQDEQLTINDYDGKGGKKTQSVREWCAADGRGFLCSTEW